MSEAALWFTAYNDEQAVQVVHRFREAAIADGWSAQPTYEGHETVERAARLYREGFQLQLLSRAPTGKPFENFYHASISAWGPDGLAIETPGNGEYPGFAFFIAGTKRCAKCERGDVETVRVGFAGRYCRECAPEARKRFETPGWTE